MIWQRPVCHMLSTLQGHMLSTLQGHMLSMLQGHILSTQQSKPVCYTRPVRQQWTTMLPVT